MADPEREKALRERAADILQLLGYEEDLKLRDRILAALKQTAEEERAALQAEIDALQHDREEDFAEIVQQRDEFREYFHRLRLEATEHESKIAAARAEGERAGREAERERAARIADHCDEAHGSIHVGRYDQARCIAAAIRSRSFEGKE